MLRVLAVQLAAACHGASFILPEPLLCSRSANTVEVEEAATDGFACPEWFSGNTCCSREDTASITGKIDDALRFIVQVLDEQKSEFEEEGPIEGDGCAGEMSRALESRTASYRTAREAVEKGVQILQGAAMHLLCAACFVCALPGKTAQVENFTLRALRSLQEALGDVYERQEAADQLICPACRSRYQESLTQGVRFPRWGSFEPAMLHVGDEGPRDAFAGWTDRVLSLLLEPLGSLLFQRSVLQLALFYADRPDSEAFALLHGPPSGVVLPTWAGEGPGAPDIPAGAPPVGPPPVCPAGPRRLLIAVPKSAAVDEVLGLRRGLANAPAWSVLWVVTAQAHAAALAGARLGGALAWRRFEVRDLDGFAAAICGGERPTWVADFSGLDAGSPEILAEAAQRLGASPGPRDLKPTAWPRGMRPARPLAGAPAFPPPPLLEHFEAHAALRSALRGGVRPPGARMLVYACTSMTLCGGHGDRLNGMLSAAVVALLSGRFLFIDSQRPVPLALVLEPRRIDWRLHGTHAALPAALNLNDDLAGFEADPGRLLESQAPVLRLVSNQRLTPAALRAAPQRAAALGLAPDPRLHAHLFEALFQPSPAFAERLRARELPEGRRIGIHFRAGDQMPQRWTDPPRHALEEVGEFLGCAATLEAALGWDATFMLFADTDRVLEVPAVAELRAKGKLLWPARSDNLIHLDRSPATLSVRGLLGTWADWWTLAFDVDALVLCQSGFGATALEIGPPRPAVLGRGCIWADGSTG